MTLLGLVDGNNFYASVERVFEPKLHGKPVVVLSSNDGCAIARSAEAKALGIMMGQPIHQVPREIRKQLVVRSSNFNLYGDMSGRVVSILRDLFPRVEVYSIDESFVSFEGIRDVEATAREARSRVLKWVGIPCCVGIGQTKTLAKAANKLAKKTADGVVHVAEPRQQLARYPVEDLWGVGRRWTEKLGAEGIITALDIMDAEPDTLRARYGVVLARTQRELQGIPCADLQEVEPDRKQIVVSRSFGAEVSDLDALQEAVSTFAIRACEKLRDRSLRASGVWVWLNTNPFSKSAAQYHPSRALRLLAPSSDTREVLGVARVLVKSMWRKSYGYQKAGVGLLDLVHTDHRQPDLFAQPDLRSSATMDVLDRVNRKFGRGTMGFGASGWREKPVWGTRREHLSPAYTTRWADLLRVR